MNPFSQFSDMLGKMKDMQGSMEKIQEEIKDIQVTGEAGAGMVKAIMTGQGLLRFEIDPSVLQEDQQVLLDLQVAAVNDGLQKLERSKQEKVQSVVSDLGIPPSLLSMLPIGR